VPIIQEHEYLFLFEIVHFFYSAEGHKLLPSQTLARCVARRSRTGVACLCGWVVLVAQAVFVERAEGSTTFPD
jgi:hypothetical protein